LKYLLVILLVTSSISYSQDVSEIYKTDTIYFYGYDFAHFTLAENHVTDPGRYIFPWVVYISKYIKPKVFEKQLSAIVLHDFTYTNSINEKVVKTLSVKTRIENKEENVTSSYERLYDNKKAQTNIISIKKSGGILDADSIQKIISNYNLEQKEGIGLVAIMEYVNKVKEATLVHFVLFDLKTKQLLKTYETLFHGGSGIGLTKHWGMSFIGNVEQFLQNFYYDYKDYKWELRKKKRIRKLK
jgi:hypothetical protein